MVFDVEKCKCKRARRNGKHQDITALLGWALARTTLWLLWDLLPIGGSGKACALCSVALSGSTRKIGHQVLVGERWRTNDETSLHSAVPMS